MCAEAVEDNEQKDQPQGTGCRKRLADQGLIGLLGLIVALVTLGGAFVVPEVRRWVGLDPVPTWTPTITPTTTPTPGVLITEVYNAGRAEHVVIYNASAVDVDLSGWRLEDSDQNVAPFIFPDGFILHPTARVKVYSGAEGNEENPPGSLSWTSTNIWNNDGDTAWLYDARDNLVDKYEY